MIETVSCAICDSRTALTAWVLPPKDEYALNLGHAGRRSRWVMCRCCGLVYQNPRPSTGEVASLYAGEVYRREITDAEANERMEYFLRRPVNAIRWLSSSRVPGPI